MMRKLSTSSSGASRRESETTIPDASRSYITAPMKSVSVVKMTRTSVRSDAAAPSIGCSCTNPSIGVAETHAGSPSTSPSRVGASATTDAVAAGRGSSATELSCAAAGVRVASTTHAGANTAHVHSASREGRTVKTGTMETPGLAHGGKPRH